MFLPGKFYLVRNLLFWVNFDVGLIMLKTHPEVHQFVLIIWNFFFGLFPFSGYFEIKQMDRLLDDMLRDCK